MTPIAQRLWDEELAEVVGWYSSIGLELSGPEGFGLSRPQYRLNKSMDLLIRPATPKDAAFMVPLINAADGGIPFQIWATMAEPGETPYEVGLRRVRGDEATVSWRKARVAEVSGERAGVVIGHRRPDARAQEDLASVPPQFRPLDELEAEAFGTGYINLMSVAEAWQGQGVGTALLLDAERWRGPRGMSVIVSDENVRARRFYERNGYAEADRRRKVKEDWQTPGTEWILLRKS